MVEAHIVRDFEIGNTRIKIADDYCRRTACEVEEILSSISEQAQRQFNAAASAMKYEREENAYISADDCQPYNCSHSIFGNDRIHQLPG